MFDKLADLVVYTLMGIDKNTHLAESLHFFIEDTAKIFVMLSAMIMVVSYFRSQFAPEKVRDYLQGKPKWMAYSLAVLLGSITPFCSCSSIPLFIGFVEAGIPFGVTMAFLITSPLINEVAILLFASILGVKITVIYVITGMTVGFLGGVVMDKFHLDRYLEKIVPAKKCCCCKNKQEPAKEEDIVGFKARTSYAWDYTKDMLKQTWLYIVIGIAIGAGIHGYVPQDFIVKYAGIDNLFAVPFAVAIGVPLYSNATGVIPIAEALLNKGVPVGTVLVFMMSVVAISLPELVILRRAMTWKLIGYFVAYLFVVLVAIGYFYNMVF